MSPSLRTIAKDALLRLAPRSRVLVRGPKDVRRVAITFDDGPDELTPEYLDLLDELQVPATFFLVGRMVEKRPELVREYLRRGHQIAGHGYDHQRFPNLWPGQLAEQLRRTQAAMGRQATGRPWVRPPHGSIGARSLTQLVASGWVVAMWSFDAHDYDLTESAKLIERCKPESMRPGEVMLFHEGQRWTLDALPAIVAGLRANGYECVTMADLFAA